MACGSTITWLLFFCGCSTFLEKGMGVDRHIRTLGNRAVGGADSMRMFVWTCWAADRDSTSALTVSCATWQRPPYRADPPHPHPLPPHTAMHARTYPPPPRNGTVYVGQSQQLLIGTQNRSLGMTVPHPGGREGWDVASNARWGQVLNEGDPPPSLGEGV